MITITDGITAHTSPVGEGLGERRIRGRRSTKANSFSCLSCPPAPWGPRHSGLQPHPPRWPSQRPPFKPCAQSGPFTRSVWASCPRPPPAPLHWSCPLPVRPRVPPTTAPPASALRPRSFPTAGTLRQLLIGPSHQPLFLIGGRCPPWAGPWLTAAGADWSLLCSWGRGCLGRPSSLSPQAEASGRPLQAGECPGPATRWGPQSGAGPGEAVGWGLRSGPGGRCGQPERGSDADTHLGRAAGRRRGRGDWRATLPQPEFLLCWRSGLGPRWRPRAYSTKRETVAFFGTVDSLIPESLPSSPAPRMTVSLFSRVKTAGQKTF